MALQGQPAAWRVSQLDTARSLRQVADAPAWRLFAESGAWLSMGMYMLMVARRRRSNQRLGG
jgi:hypothetical protein